MQACLLRAVKNALKDDLYDLVVLYFLTYLKKRVFWLAVLNVFYQKHTEFNYMFYLVLKICRLS